MLFGFTITNIIANITLKITTPLKGKKEKTTKESALLHHMLLMVHNPSLDDFEALAKDSYLILLERPLNKYVKSISQEPLHIYLQLMYFMLLLVQW